MSHRSRKTQGRPEVQITVSEAHKWTVIHNKRRLNKIFESINVDKAIGTLSLILVCLETVDSQKLKFQSDGQCLTK